MGITQWWRRLTGRGRGGGPDAAGDTDEQGRPSRATPGAHKRGRPPTTARPERGSGVTQPTGRPGRRPDPDPARPVLGIDATRSGWVGALLDETGHGTPHLLVSDTLPGLLEQAGPVTVVAVGVPLGLPDEGRREADVQTRRFLAGQGSTVLTTPVRDAVYAASHGEANGVSRSKGGSGVSSQAWELRRRIQELDAWVRQDLPFVVVETHPEAAFATLAGAPLSSRRRTGEGSAQRRSALAAGGVYAPASAPHGVSTDDVLDACAAAWSAHRVKTGEARSLPEEPRPHSDGIPAAIHV